MNKHKIYTKKGDTGTTSLIGGIRVPKSDTRIEAYGTLDELNSFVGLIRDFSIDQTQKDTLNSIQTHISIAESLMAAGSVEALHTLPGLSEENIQLLETEIDRMNQNLPQLTHFLLPGGHPVVSYCHIARTVCRRAERIIVGLNPTNQKQTLVVKYINRLSDYLFVLARHVAKDLGIAENLWKI
ncbi:MAG: cob(I)yrinic acid a,c-diamide adenosyltransferase [Bacteroidota bacterium]